MNVLKQIVNIVVSIFYNDAHIDHEPGRMLPRSRPCD